MDTVSDPNSAPQAPVPPAILVKKKICPQCHQPVLPEYYFCPNCGKNLEEKPLSTTVGAQIWLYTFSLILMPMTCYLIYSKWQGWKYFKSDDPKAKDIGLISIILLGVSFLLLIWITWAGIAALQKYWLTEESSINTMGLGGLGSGL